MAYFILSKVGMTLKLPYVFVIDIDGTLIGDVMYHVSEWEILSQYNNKQLRTFRNELVEHLRSGLLRPHFTDFISQFRSTCEFYIYTASDDKWAQFLVPCIEAACGVKFARPIFSRRHCIVDGSNTKKSLSRVSGLVFSRLKVKYGFKSIGQVYQQMMLIDNNKVLVDKESKKGVLCSSYTYMQPYDVLRNLHTIIFNSNAYRILTILARYGVVQSSHVRSNANAIQLLAIYHSSLAGNLMRYSKELSYYDTEKKDKFWAKLSGIVSVCLEKQLSCDNLIKYVNLHLVQ